MKKLAAPFALALLILLAAVPTVLAANVNFSAVNNEILPLEPEYMPYKANGAWYVPVPVLTHSTGVSSSFSRDQQTLVLFNAAGKELKFNLRANNAYDYDQQYSIRAIQSGSFFYVPADFVVTYFGMSYSELDCAYGKVLRLKTKTVVNDVSFLAAAEALIKRHYDTYTQLQTPSPEISGGVTPQISPTPSPTPTPIREVYLTFDDGPKPNTTPQILDTLDEYNMKATFFVLGEEIEKAPAENADLLRRMLCGGHTIGLHGYSHNHFYDSADRMLTDLARTNDLLYEAAFYRTRLVRTPYGSGPKNSPNLTQELQAALTGAGYRFWDWNIDPKDAVPPQPKADKLVSRTISQLESHLDKFPEKPAVIVMHDQQNTADALPDILRYLKSERYTVHVITEHELPMNMLDNIH